MQKGRRKGRRREKMFFKFYVRQVELGRYRARLWRGAGLGLMNA